MARLSLTRPIAAALQSRSWFRRDRKPQYLAAGYRYSLGYEWAAPWRFRRIDEVLRARKGFTIEDFQRLQHDETSLPARLLHTFAPGDSTSDGSVARYGTEAARLEFRARPRIDRGRHLSILGGKTRPYWSGARGWRRRNFASWAAGPRRTWRYNGSETPARRCLAMIP